jgi:flagellar hook-length control protein FliK
VNTVENALLQQMQKLAASLTAMPGTASKDKAGQDAVSFQDMMQQSNKAAGSKDKDSAGKPVREDGEVQDGETAPVQKEDEELKPETLVANPNAVNVMTLIRPEIVEAAGEPVEAVIDPIPQETVEGAAMDLTGEMTEMDTSVDSGIGAEVSMEQQPKDFQQAMEEGPQQQEGAQNVQTQQTAPQRQVQETDKPEAVSEVRVDREETEEPSGEMAAAEQPVFEDTRVVPVKVGERYEVVDTQKPEMEENLADTIRTAVQTGQERIEIRLAPQNLGSLVIEMTRDVNGALQVVLHASTPKAEGLLNQHLNGLQTALQGYGHENVHLEVQRGQESQEQHFQQADPDGRGQHQNRNQQQDHEEETSSAEEFMQKLRLGLFGTDE